MVRVKDPRRSRNSGKYDPRITLRMRGEAQVSLNGLDPEFRNEFRAVVKGQGLTMKAAVAKLMAEDVASGGLPGVPGPEAVAMVEGGQNTSLSLPEDTLEAFRGLCASRGVAFRSRLVGLMLRTVKRRR